MTQSSEERAPATEGSSSTARILPFERPQSELQRAVQQRAQERIEAESIKPKVSIVRRIMTLAVAMVPVLLLFTGFMISIQAIRFITSLYATTPEPEVSAPQYEEQPEPSQPGVVMLVPDRSIPADPASVAPATGDQSPANQGSEPAPKK